MAFAHVALPIPLRRTFAYRIPDAMAARVRPGAQVQAPFRGRPRRGLVLEIGDATPDHEVLELADVLEERAISPHLLLLGRWIADYYLAPIGEVLVAMLPGGMEGFAASRARRSAVEDLDNRLAMPDRVTPTAGQRAALDAVAAAIDRGAFAPLLLHGVTASGKTEVYLRAAQRVRERGRQTLLLVPEVALSGQLVGEFRRRFGGRIGVLHSYLTVGERRRNWELASRGALDVVVGARSAVFAPLPALGMIVVDEEHEPAYKQSDRLRYHGRDVAVRRAQMLRIPVVLGSATPSLESLANAARDKYQRVRLPDRVDGRHLPKIHVVDLRRESAAGGGSLSPTLRAAIVERLARKEQSVLFLNRRGHSHHVQCRGCGHVPECPHCDIALTLHLAPRRLRCHYCEHEAPAPSRCRECGAELFRYSGSGTQRVERELASAIPAARVLRLDADVARDRGAVHEVIAAFRAGEADVLVGTQMVAKGFDFPRVTLVGVVDADVGLHLPDFRAAERTWQLLVQVSGRSGRGKTAGEVCVQTCTPDHPAIAAAVLHDDRAFLDHELAQRKDAGYPPYVRLATLSFAGKQAEAVERVAHEAAELLRGLGNAVDAALLDEGAVHEPEAGRGEGVQVLGPAPNAHERLRGLHRWHLLLKSADGHALRRAAAHTLDALESRPGRSSVRITVDIDPVEVL